MSLINTEKLTYYVGKNAKLVKPHPIADKQLFITKMMNKAQFYRPEIKKELDYRIGYSNGNNKWMITFLKYPCLDIKDIIRRFKIAIEEENDLGMLTSTQDQFIITFLDGTKFDPIRYRFPTGKERAEKLLKYLKYMLWGYGDMYGQRYKSIKGKLKKIVKYKGLYPDYKGVDETLSYINKIKAKNERFREVSNLYEKFVNKLIPYEDFSDLNLDPLPILGELKIQINQ